MDNHLKRLYNYGNSWPADTIPPEVAGTIGRLETLVILTYSTGDADLFEPVISELERIRDRCKGGRACDA